jgi:hypothetical protein
MMRHFMRFQARTSRDGNSYNDTAEGGERKRDQIGAIKDPETDDRASFQGSTCCESWWMGLVCRNIPPQEAV